MMSERLHSTVSVTHGVWAASVVDEHGRSPDDFDRNAWGREMQRAAEVIAVIQREAPGVMAMVVFHPPDYGQ